MHPMYYLIVPLAGFAIFNRARFLYKGIVTKDRDRILVEVMFLLIILAILAALIVLIEKM